jgi:DNA-directed RNA polymerase subunit RPC12/RpoP
MKSLSENANMTTTLIIKCSKCGGLLLAQAAQETRSCPYCSFRISVDRAMKLATAKNAYEASNILQKLKQEKALKQKGKGFQ